MRPPRVDDGPRQVVSETRVRFCREFRRTLKKRDVDPIPDGGFGGIMP